MAKSLSYLDGKYEKKREEFWVSRINSRTYPLSLHYSGPGRVRVVRVVLVFAWNMEWSSIKLIGHVKKVKVLIFMYIRYITVSCHG